MSRWILAGASLAVAAIAAAASVPSRAQVSSDTEQGRWGVGAPAWNRLEYAEIRQIARVSSRRAEIEAAARNGDPEAATLAACALSRGWWGSNDLLVAQAYARQAAKAGFGPAMNELALLIMQEQGMGPRFEALKWLELAAEAKNSDAMIMLANREMSGLGRANKRDPVQALYWLREAKQVGSPFVDTQIASLEREVSRLPTSAYDASATTNLDKQIAGIVAGSLRFAKAGSGQDGTALLAHVQSETAALRATGNVKSAATIDRYVSLLQRVAAEMGTIDGTFDPRQVGVRFPAREIVENLTILSGIPKAASLRAGKQGERLRLHLQLALAVANEDLVSQVIQSGLPDIGESKTIVSEYNLGNLARDQDIVRQMPVLAKVDAAIARDDGRFNEILAAGYRERLKAPSIPGGPSMWDVLQTIRGSYVRRSPTYWLVGDNGIGAGQRDGYKVIYLYGVSDLQCSRADNDFICSYMFKRDIDADANPVAGVYGAFLSELGLDVPGGRLKPFKHTATFRRSGNDWVSPTWTALVAEEDSIRCNSERRETGTATIVTWGPAVGYFPEHETKITCSKAGGN